MSLRCDGKTLLCMGSNKGWHTTSRWKNDDVHKARNISNHLSSPSLVDSAVVWSLAENEDTKHRRELLTPNNQTGLEPTHPTQAILQSLLAQELLASSCHGAVQNGGVAALKIHWFAIPASRHQYQIQSSLLLATSSRVTDHDAPSTGRHDLLPPMTQMLCTQTPL